MSSPYNFCPNETALPFRFFYGSTKKRKFLQVFRGISYTGMGVRLEIGKFPGVPDVGRSFTDTHGYEIAPVHAFQKVRAV